MGTPQVLFADSVATHWVEEPDTLTTTLAAGTLSFTLAYAGAIPVDATPQYIDLLLWVDPTPEGASPPFGCSLNGYHEDGNSFTWPSQSPGGDATPVSGAGMGFPQNHSGVRFRQLYPFPLTQRAFSIDGMAVFDANDSRFTVSGLSVIRGYTIPIPVVVTPPPPPPPIPSRSLAVGGYASGYVF